MVDWFLPFYFNSQFIFDWLKNLEMKKKLCACVFVCKNLLWWSQSNRIEINKKLHSVHVTWERHEKMLHQRHSHNDFVIVLQLIVLSCFGVKYFRDIFKCHFFNSLSHTLTNPLRSLFISFSYETSHVIIPFSGWDTRACKTRQLYCLLSV